MKILKIIGEIFLVVFSITLTYIIVNNSQLLSWQIMEKMWIFYPALCGFSVAFIYQRHYTLSGGGLFLSFCILTPPMLFSYYAVLPWGEFFVHPYPVILAAVFSALGEATSKITKSEKENKELQG